ncbi:MAG: hypothetical protein GYA76_08160, partial [Verrucomicrobia bacterium]|nr:hypothetical protein [Verrucomicrobiota bacterium]
MAPWDPALVPDEADEALLALVRTHANRWSAAAAPGGSATQRREEREGFAEGLENYLQQFAHSRGELGLRLTLGTYYQRQARWSLALPHLETAWALAQTTVSPDQVRFADRAQVALGLALLELGRGAALDELLRQSQRRPARSPGWAAVWRGLRESWAEMREDSSLGSLLCGARALNSLGIALGSSDLSVWEVLQDATPLDAQGFTLGRLQQIGQRHGVALQAAVRGPGAAWVTPAVVHWTEDLWRTVLAVQGPGFWVDDPTRGRVWMSAEHLEQEVSGYCVVRSGALPPGWRAATSAEAAQVVGRSYAVLPRDAEDEQCEGGCADECPPGHGGSGFSIGPGRGGAEAGMPSGAGSEPMGIDGSIDRIQGSCACTAPACNCPTGLPRWRVSEPFINIWLEDEPWGYPAPRGPAPRLGLSHKLRDQAVVDGYPWVDPWEPLCTWQDQGEYPPMGSSFGFGWASRWFSYLCHYEEGDEQWGIPDRVVVRTAGRGFIDIYLLPSEEASDPVYSSHAVVKRLRDGQGAQIGWEVEYPGGERYQYTKAATSAWLGTRYFLTQYLDRAGQALQFEYDELQTACEQYYTQTIVRWSGLRDAVGSLSTLAYTNLTYPTLITSITDPDGRVARFAYDGDGYLTNITDVAGIEVGFEYAQVDPTFPRMLWRMSTPYGQTSFHVTDKALDDTLSYTRGLAVVMPEGRRMVALYSKDTQACFPEAFAPEAVPQGLPIANAADTGERNARNSYFWDLAQAAQLSTTNLSQLNAQDYRLARTRHWLLVQYPKPVSTTASWEQAPSADGQCEGGILWYGHDDKPSISGRGSSSLPNLVARVIPDGTTWYKWLERNALGHPTNITERWIDPSDVERFRTESSVYAANGIDLVAHFGPDGLLKSGYAYDPNIPHLPVAQTNALGEVTRFFYDSVHNGRRLLGVAYPSGLALTNVYDGAWLQDEVMLIGTNPLRTNRYTWLNGYVLTHQDPRGLTRTFTHDALGRLTRIDYPDSTYVEQVYTNGAGVMLLERTGSRDRLGNWTRYEYNGLRQVTRILDPLLRETRYTYCGCGGPESITRAYGTPVAQTTQHQYDFAARLTQTTASDGTTVTNLYDALGRLAIISQAVGTATNYYDNLGRLWLVENAGGVVAESAYDLEDRVLSHTDANGVTVTNAYDALGRLTVRVTPANGATETWAYTSGVSGPTSYVNQVSNVTLYAYDAAGRKTNEVQVGVFTNRFTYTAAGDLATLADGKANTTAWKHDSEGRVIEKWYQGQATADLLHGYNANGWLTWRFTRTGTGSATNGFFTSYAYDRVGNLTNITYPSGTASITNWFDALGRLTNRLDGLGVTLYQYAMLGSGLQTFGENGPWTGDTDLVTVTNQYGRRVGLAIKQPTGQFVVTNAWDAAGRWAVVGGTAGTFSYSYPQTASVQPIGIALPGGGYLTNGYRMGRLTNSELRNPTGALLNRHGYQYNAANQRTLLGRTNSAVSAWNGYLTAAYDAAGQLAQAWAYQPNGTPVTAEKWSYGYDAAQNLSK